MLLFHFNRFLRSRGKRNTARRQSGGSAPDPPVDTVTPLFYLYQNPYIVPLLGKYTIQIIQHNSETKQKPHVSIQLSQQSTLIAKESSMLMSVHATRIADVLQIVFILCLHCVYMMFVACDPGPPLYIRFIQLIYFIFHIVIFYLYIIYIYINK